MAITKKPITEKNENNFSEFYKKLETFVPELKKFMVGSLKAAENQGLLDGGFYSADEMLDEVYMDAFKTLSNETDTIKLRRLLFNAIIKKLEVKKSQEIPDGVTTHALLKAELKTLSEEFTTDGDGDRILYEELDDISYKQKQGWSKKIYLNEELEKQLVTKMELHEASLLSDEKRRLLGISYDTIPPRSKTVMELFTFGGQSTGEISKILEVPEEIVNRILFKLKERFRLI